MLDTKGPEIQSGFLKDHQPVQIKEGQHLKIVTDMQHEGDNETIACSYESLPQSVQMGGTIFIRAKETLNTTIIEIEDDYVVVKCENDAWLGECCYMNLPGVIVDLPTLTEKDEDDICDFGIE